MYIINNRIAKKTVLMEFLKHTLLISKNVVDCVVAFFALAIEFKGRI